MAINTGFFKQVEDGSSVIKPITVHTNSVTNSGTACKYYVADRRNLTNSQNNIFMTMNLPLTPTQQTVFQGNFATGTSYNFSGTSGFNQNVIIYTPITGTSYGELVVGHSIHMKVPVQSAATTFGPVATTTCGVIPCVQTLDIYGSYEYQGGYQNSFDNLTSESSINAVEYGQPIYNINNELTNYNPYKSNVVFLFSDFVRRPNNDSSKSWATQSTNALINTNKVFKDGKDTFNYESLPLTGRDKIDVPVGLCMLDAGFCAITHPYIVNIMALTAGTVTGAGWVTPSDGTYSGPGNIQSDNGASGEAVGVAWSNANSADAYGETNFLPLLPIGGATGVSPWVPGPILPTGWSNQGDSGTPFTAVYFTGGTTNGGTADQITAVSASTSFRTVSTDYIQSITCVAEAGSWGTSTNPTWVEEYSESGSNNAGVYITKIGLWDDNYNLLGVAVPDVPILKTQTQYLTATLNLTR
jgi:hypothetical protein|tara:strand:+ start:1678 stop:3087 length:1410 start_codon:yes stop_codon:yes gene_type:complete